MKSFYRYLIFLLLPLMMDCRKEAVSAIGAECITLEKGLIERSEADVKELFDRLTEDLLPQPVAEDQLGHAENLETLVRRLSNICTFHQVIYYVMPVFVPVRRYRRSLSG